MRVTVTVVGLGADGWPGLSEISRTAVLEAELVVGSARQLALLPAVAGQQSQPLLPGGLEAVGDQEPRMPTS